MIKFGIRQNLFYPLMFISFIFARRIMKHLIENEDHNNFKCPFLLVLLMFVSEIIISVIIYFKNQRTEKNEIKELYSKRNIKLINRIPTIRRTDKIYIIFILIIFASYFDFIGSITRNYIKNQIKIMKILIIEEEVSKYVSPHYYVIILLILGFINIRKYH